MKKHLTIIALFCLIGTAHAQTTKVYGNLGLGNVNISVINTQYGTSSDTKGYYELFFYDRTKSINLYYSCIGYQDTIDLDSYEIVETNKAFEVSARRPLKVGGYDPKAGTVAIGQKASSGIYPRVFKIHDGYAYSVCFDKTKNRGVINRVKIN